MLTEQEQAFVTYWESVRIEQSKMSSKLVRGLPVAVLFTLPILISVVAVELFSPDWFTKISNKAIGSTWPILISLVLIIIFFSFVRMHFKWEMNDQLYGELKQKSKDLNQNNSK
jgi:hypothetical protein